MQCSKCSMPLDKEGKCPVCSSQPIPPSGKRPPVLDGKTYKVFTSCGNLYITVNHIDKIPIEVFATLGKAGACVSCFLQALTRVVSLALRAGVSPEKVIKTLINCRCPSPSFGNTHLGKGLTESCPDAIARVLKLELATTSSLFSEQEAEGPLSAEKNMEK